MKEKYRVSASGLVALIKKLMAQNLITAGDLETRKRKAVQRDLAKEAQFLSGLFLCPACGHPHPQRFETCPACGACVEDFLHTEGALDSVTTSAGHIYVDEVEEMAKQHEAKEAAGDWEEDLDLDLEEEEEEEPEEEPVEEEDIVDESGSFDVEDEDEIEDSRTFVPIEQEEPEEPEEEPEPEKVERPEPVEPERESTIGTIKSFFSKKFKKK